MTSQTLGWGRSVWRWLLQLDRPVLPRTEAELEAEAAFNFRWNFTVSFLDGAFFWLGISFISQATILPLFVAKLTTSPLLIALLAVLGQSSWYLPQLFVAGPTEKLARKKPVVVNLGFFTERLPLWLLPLAALLSAYSPPLALLLFFLAYAAHGLGAGAIAPAWTDMLARCFPIDLRGRFFGITSFVGTGLGALGAIFSVWLLAAYPFPVNFALAFTVAAAFVTLSWVFIALTREPVKPVPDAIRAEKGMSWVKIRTILAGDRNFRSYLIVRLLASLGAMASGFATVAALVRWNIPDSTVGFFTAALLIGQTVGTLVAGFVADHSGHKLSLELSFAASAAAYLLALFAPAPIWFNAVFFLMGVTGGMTLVSGVLVNMEFSRPERRPTYVGIANTTVGIGAVLAPLIGGLIALLGYNLLFAVSSFLGLLALFALHFMVREPRMQTDYLEI